MYSSKYKKDYLVKEAESSEAAFNTVQKEAYAEANYEEGYYAEHT